MLVQSYKDENYARLLHVGNLIVDLTHEDHYLPRLKDVERLKLIDKMMHRLGFYRRTKWEKINWGWEANIRRGKVKDQ